MTRITWRAALVSVGLGSLSVLRADLRGALVAGERAAQRGFRRAPERRRNSPRRRATTIDGAAHQGCAAKAGQDRAGEPLNGNAAAIDDAEVAPSTSNGGSLPRSIGSDGQPAADLDRAVCLDPSDLSPSLR